MIHTVTLNPAIDKTVQIPYFHPGEVNRITSLRIDAGGKGINVSRVIKALGGESIAWGLLGVNGGNVIESTLNAEGIQTQFVKQQSEVRVNLKIIDSRQSVNTDINEPGTAASEEELNELCRRLCAAVRPEDIVILTGSLPPHTEPSLYYEWIRLLKKAEARVFLDTDRDAFRLGIKALPFLIKPNRSELEQLRGESFQNLVALQIEGRSLIGNGIRNVVISLGAEGALFMDERESFFAEGLKVQVQSTVGAGDSMTAALALCLQEGRSLAEAASISVAVSAAKVMCDGSNPPEKAQIDMLLSQVRLRAL